MTRRPFYVSYTVALALFVALPVQAADTPTTFDHVKAGFTQAVEGIQGWFGADNGAYSNIEPAAGDMHATDQDEMLAIPPRIDPALIEPAAGFDEDMLQVPPRYVAPVSDALPRATAFDGAESMAAFGAPIPSADELAGIATAAGGDETGCEIEADANIAGEEDSQSVACEHNAVTPATPAQRTPAQPAFEQQQPAGTLPETRPAAGE